MKNIEVCLSPDLIKQFALEQKAVVIVDILRASSCMVAAFYNNVAEIIPVATVEECKKLMNNGYLGAAERDGLKVEGFDLDNSPFTYLEKDIQGKKIAMTTTNGTQALVKSAHASNILIGAFTNLSAIASRLMDLNKDIVIVCAGWKGNFNLEDTLFAGAVLSLLQHKVVIEQDAAFAALNLYENNKHDLLAFVNKSQHVKRLAGLNITKDIAFCLTFDEYDVVPVLVNDRLKIAKNLVLN